MSDYPKLSSSELLLWADTGEKDSPSTGKIDTGWLAGEKPPHEYLNWWQNKVDRFIVYLLQKGVPEYDPTFPYILNSICKGSTGSLFIALSPSTGQNPETDITNTYWKKLIDSSGSVAVDDISPYAYTLLAAVDADDAQGILGGTTVGKAVFSAVDQVAARTAIGGSVFLDRANHTGTQAISTVTNLQTELDDRELLANKVVTLVGANDTTYPTSKAVADAISVAASGERYKGEWDASTNTPTIVSGVGVQGDYYVVSVAGTTTIDGISSWVEGDEIFFDGSVWLKRPTFFPSLTTDDVTEATNQYFTTSRVRGTLLTGVSFVTNTVISATDTVLAAFGKLQAQITDLFSRTPPSGGTTGQILTKASGTDFDFSWTTPSNGSSVAVNNLGERATTTSETVALDLSANTEWNVSLNTANTTGNLTLNLTNLPSTTNAKYVGYIRIVRGGRKTVIFTVPAGKTWNWIQNTAPTFTATTGEYDVVMFYNMLGEAKIHAMVVDTGVV